VTHYFCLVYSGSPISSTLSSGWSVQLHPELPYSVREVPDTYPWCNREAPCTGTV